MPKLTATVTMDASKALKALKNKENLDKELKLDIKVESISRTTFVATLDILETERKEWRILNGLKVKIEVTNVSLKEKLESILTTVKEIQQEYDLKLTLVELTVVDKK